MTDVPADCNPSLNGTNVPSAPESLLFTPAYWQWRVLNDVREPEPAPLLTLNVSPGYSLAHTLERLQSAMMALPGPPRLYQRTHRLVRVVHGAPAPQGILRPADAPVILAAQPAWVRMIAQQAAQFVRTDRRKHDEEVATLPPRDVIETLMVQHDWFFPPLISVITAPTLRPDGSLLLAPGYDSHTHLYLDLKTCGELAVPESPTLGQAHAARLALEEPFLDFPFAAPHDLAAALAALLSLVCRHTLGEGCVPLFGITATTRASGKGLLCDVIATIATGRIAPKWAPTLDQEEERKSLLTLALEGDPLVCLDNCVHPLGSPALDSALTAATIKGRILGETASAEAPMRLVFFATGNNLRYKGDLARRVLPIALDPKMERPEERDTWRHPELLRWVHAHRARLLTQALTLMRGYFAAGCPAQGVKPLGSFEPWSRVIREALIWAGAADPCLGRQDLEAESDSEYEAIALLLHAWHACYGTDALTLHTVGQDVGLGRAVRPDPPNKWDDLYTSLAQFDKRADGVKPLNMESIGRTFHTFQGRVIDARRLVKAGKTRTNKVQWKLEVIGDCAPASSA